MRFLYVLCVGLFCTCMFGQGPISNQSTPPGTPLASLSSAAELTSEDGQAPVSDPQMSKPTQLPMPRLSRNSRTALRTTGNHVLNGCIS